MKESSGCSFFTLYLYDSGLFWASFVVLFAAFAAILCNTNMESTLKNHGLIEDGKNRKVVRLVIVKNTRSTVALQDRIRRRTRDAYEDKKKKKKTSTSASYVAEDETKQNKIQPVPV